MEKAMLLLSGGIDSPVAGWMMKKTMDVLAVHFSLEPYTDSEPEEKSRKLAARLCVRNFTVINIAKELRDIAEKCDRKYYFVLLKRLMFRKADELARSSGCHYLLTGESIGQVSSQTLENLAVIDDATALTVLRPLIAMDKQKIIATAEKIGTFDISRGKETCDVLGPDHPSTRARLQVVRKEEEKLLTTV